jgi:pyrroline-5-carboxylate reductase
MNNISIIGAGHLTESLLDGISRIHPIPVFIYNRTENKLKIWKNKYPFIIPISSIQHTVTNSNFIFVMTNAEHLFEITDELRESLQKNNAILVSCIATLSLSQIENKLPGCRVVRLLPNVNWSSRNGVTLYKCNELVSTNEKDELLQFLSVLSLCHEITDENDFERLTKITSCGPGLYGQIMHELCRVFDIRNNDELGLFYSSFAGTLETCMNRKIAPIEIKNEVATKGGITEAGASILESNLHEIFSKTKDVMENRIQERREKYRKEWSE